MSQEPKPQDFILAALSDVGAMVDVYGALKAEAAAIEAKLDAIKKALLATGRAEFREGRTFDATVAISNRESVSIKDLRAKFGAEVEPLIKLSADIYTVRCTAKKVK